MGGKGEWGCGLLSLIGGGSISIPNSDSRPITCESVHWDNLKEEREGSLVKELA